MHARAHSRHQRGFTLIEMVVSLAIMTIIAGAVGVAFTVGFKALQPGGVQARLAGADDLEVLEQLLGQDGARASCITVNGIVYGKTSTTCTTTTGYGQVSACSTAIVCFGWAVLGTAKLNYADSTCQVAVYAANVKSTPNDLERTVWSVAYSKSWSASEIGQTIIDHEYSVTVAPGTIGTVTTPSGYKWVRSLLITITGGTTSHAPAAQLAIHPLASDPDDPSPSAVTPEGTPC